MLIQSRRFISALHFWTDHDSCHMSSAMLFIAAGAFVEKNYEYSILLKSGACDQGCDVCLQPGIRRAQTAVMPVMQHVGHDEGELGKALIREIRRKLCEWYQVVFLGAVGHVRKVGEWVVMFHIGIDVASRVTCLRKTVNVGLPRLAGGEQMPNHIVLRQCATKSVIVCNDLAGAEHEVIADGRMRIRVILRCQCVFAGKTVQVG